MIISYFQGLFPGLSSGAFRSHGLPRPYFIWLEPSGCCKANWICKSEARLLIHALNVFPSEEVAFFINSSFTIRLFQQRWALEYSASRHAAIWHCSRSVLHHSDMHSVPRTILDEQNSAKYVRIPDRYGGLDPISFVVLSVHSRSTFSKHRLVLHYSPSKTQNTRREAMAYHYRPFEHVDCHFPGRVGDVTGTAGTPSCYFKESEPCQNNKDRSFRWFYFCR